MSVGRGVDGCGYGVWMGVGICGWVRVGLEIVFLLCVNDRLNTTMKLKNPIDIFCSFWRAKRKCLTKKGCVLARPNQTE